MTPLKDYPFTDPVPGGGEADPHVHDTDDVTGLDAALAGKAESTHTHAGLVTALDPRLSDPRPPTAHGHSQAEIASLVADLAGKAGVGHTHAPSGGGSRFPATIALGGYLVLTNVGATYDFVPVSRGLGFAEVDFTGAVRLDLTLFVNKIGTGTQSWQLWNVTDGAEILVIDDNGAAGEKTLTGSKLALLLVGVKRIRLRAKSTVAGDDPVLLGASVRLS